MLRTSCLLALFTLAACDEEPAAPATPAAPPPHAQLDIDDPSVCATCHAAVVEEWRTSIHSMAHHDRDPIYGAMRTLRMAREGDELATRCAGCHGPRDPSDPDSEISRTGVSCATCHHVESIDLEGGRKGAAAITWANGDMLRGPHDASGGSAPHAVGEPSDWVADGTTLCLTCHQAMRNAQGVETCSTGTEYEQVGDAQSCASCPMPRVDTPSGSASRRTSHLSHAFVGPHRLWREGDEPRAERAFLATAFSMTPTFTEGNLRVSVRNQTAHSLPSGFPGRMIVVVATAYNAEGETVWQNFREDPMAEDPSAVFNKVYVDAEGTVVLPPYGVRIARDTRLEPNEERALEWTLPASATRVEVSAMFRLLPPPAAALLGVTGPLAEARPLITLTVTRDGSTQRTTLRPEPAD